MHFRIREVLLKIPPIRDINETGRNMCIKGQRPKANRKQKSLLVKTLITSNRNVLWS